MTAELLWVCKNSYIVSVWCSAMQSFKVMLLVKITFGDQCFVHDRVEDRLS